RDVGDQENQRQPQLAPDEPIDRQAHEPERRGNRRGAQDQVVGMARQPTIPFLKDSSSAAVTLMVSGFLFEPPTASRSGTPPRAPADAVCCDAAVCLPPPMPLSPKRPFLGSSFLSSAFLSSSFFL